MKKAATLTRSNALFISMFSILLMLFFSFFSLFCYAHTEAEIESLVLEEYSLQMSLISYAFSDCENSMETFDRYVSAWELDSQQTTSIKSKILQAKQKYHDSEQENPIDTLDVMLDYVDCDYFAEFFAKNPPEPRLRDFDNSELADHRSEIDLVYDEILTRHTREEMVKKLLDAGYAGLSDESSP